MAEPSSGRQSPKFLAAMRANLEKGRRAPRRMTPARRRALLKNLEKARAADRRRGRLTAAQLTARRANAAKASAALQARGLTPEHLAKLRENVARARACATDASYARMAQSNVQHGFYSRRLRDTAEKLGENPREFDTLTRLTRRYLAPQNEAEKELSDAIAREIWRHQRLHRAVAQWKLRRLMAFLEAEPPLASADPEVLVWGGYGMLECLAAPEKAWREGATVRGRVERLMRRLIRLRAGRPDAKFRTRWRRRREPDEEEWIEKFLPIRWSD
jgi:hypothetical protein